MNQTTPNKTVNSGISGIARSLWEWWKRVGKKIGDFQARLILILFYFVILGPFAMGLRWWSDPLRVKASTRRGWRIRANPEGATIDLARRQF
jgi:hypothetical protein